MTADPIVGIVTRATARAEAAEEEGLRDYFAAQALMGLLSDATYNPPFLDAATTAYRFADAMLEARKVTTAASAATGGK